MILIWKQIEMPPKRQILANQLLRLNLKHPKNNRFLINGVSLFSLVLSSDSVSSLYIYSSSAKSRTNPSLNKLKTFHRPYQRNRNLNHSLIRNPFLNRNQLSPVCNRSYKNWNNYRRFKKQPKIKRNHHSQVK